MRGIFQLWVGCHVQPNTIEYIVDYSKQNGTDFRFMGEGCQSYNDLFAHSEIFISLMHVCDYGPLWVNAYEDVYPLFTANKGGHL